MLDSQHPHHVSQQSAILVSGIKDPLLTSSSTGTYVVHIRASKQTLLKKENKLKDFNVFEAGSVVQCSSMVDYLPSMEETLD